MKPAASPRWRQAFWTITKRYVNYTM
jgi:hypothetical protein